MQEKTSEQSRKAGIEVTECQGTDGESAKVIPLNQRQEESVRFLESLIDDIKSGAVTSAAVVVVTKDEKVLEGVMVPTLRDETCPFLLLGGLRVVERTIMDRYIEF